MAEMHIDRNPIEPMPTAPSSADALSRWFVMRDLKRANAKVPAFKMLTSEGFDVFTPTKWRLAVRMHRKVREEVPVISDLLFVNSTRTRLDEIVDRTPTLQYRFVKGAPYRTPMVVGDTEMQHFITAVRSTDTPRYYAPGEITPGMIGRRIEIVDGPLAGCIGNLLAVRGARKKRLLVRIDGILTIAVEVNPEFIKLLS